MGGKHRSTFGIVRVRVSGPFAALVLPCLHDAVVNLLRKEGRNDRILKNGQENEEEEE